MFSFDKARYSIVPGNASTVPIHCTNCQQNIASRYYRINGDIACESCAIKARSAQQTENRIAFKRAILFGIGGAILGVIGYTLFQPGTGRTIGFLAVGIGFLVGKALKIGSKGRGGRSYQVAAFILTYISVCIAALLVSFHHEGSGETTSDAVTLVSDYIFIGLMLPLIQLNSESHGFIGLLLLVIAICIAWFQTSRQDFTNEISGPFGEEDPK